MFRRILVVADHSPCGRSAAAFATDMAQEFGATAWLMDVTDPERRHGHPDSGDTRDDHAVLNRGGVGVSGSTRATNDHNLVATIAGEAARFGADVVVLGLERRRVGRRFFSRALQQEVARATSVPVMVAPARS